MGVRPTDSTQLFGTQAVLLPACPRNIKDLTEPLPSEPLTFCLRQQSRDPEGVAPSHTKEERPWGLSQSPL